MPLHPPGPKVVDISPRLLKSWPLPYPMAEGEGESRGRVLIVGGAAEMPGTVILAGTAALRVGAGNLRVATGHTSRLLVAAAIPEARVFDLPEDGRGMLAPEAMHEIVKQANMVDAMLVGPGLVDWNSFAALLQHVLLGLHRPSLVLDAAALAVVSATPTILERFEGNVVLIAHAEELARLLDVTVADIRDSPLKSAQRAAHRFNASVVLKGRDACVAAPNGRTYLSRMPSPGLGTSGSADVLAGIVAGLMGRGAESAQAAVWGLALHTAAGDVLENRLGPIGYLASDLLLELPPLLVSLAEKRSRR